MSAFGRTIGLVVVALVLASANASAHRHDELLQAARIGIGQQRVELAVSLTPGIAIAGMIIIEVDRNRDGRLSEDEQRDYLAAVASAFDLALDGHPLTIVPVASTFPAIEVLRGGATPIELRLTAALPALPFGTHRLSFTNAYRRDIGVYLMNALVPDDDRIRIEQQQRDPEQRSTTIEYTIASTSSAMLPLLMFAPAAGAWLFFRRRLLPV